MNRPDWAEHALNIARAAALRSEDPYCQVGATVLDADGIVRGVGYNGTVSGVEIDWSDREARRPYVIHAEANALRFTTPAAVEDGLLATTHFPCSTCVLLAGSYGIAKIVWELPPDWGTYPFKLTESIADRLGIDMRQALPDEPFSAPRFTMADWLASTKRLQVEAYGLDPSTLAPEEQTEWARKMILGLIAEATEVLGEVSGWRWWASGNGAAPLNRDAYIEELVDVAHFTGALALAVGCTDAQWAEAYARKSAINRVRQGVQP